jgi:site-specific DNA-cytosine methylase
VLGIDNDSAAVTANKALGHNVIEGDICTVDTKGFPSFDVLVAGFPCQPFSTSGKRQGFLHNSGHVFLALSEIIARREPRLLVFENVTGLLGNKQGHTFASILVLLSQRGYQVEWLTLDLSWFGVPQTRPRLFMFCTEEKIWRKENRAPPHRQGRLSNEGSGLPAPFHEEWLLDTFGGTYRYAHSGDVLELEAKTRPTIGRAVGKGSPPFTGYGVAADGVYSCYRYDVSPKHVPISSLGSVVAPELLGKEAIRSGRYYARGKPTSLCLREEAISHCVGTTLGGAPLYAINKETVKKKSALQAFLRYANWNRAEQTHHVMRLAPERAVHLFGEDAAVRISRAIAQVPIGLTRKYVLVGNLVSPLVARWLAEKLTKSVL